VPASWPIEAYQSIFSIEPGSAEMPSAARPFTPRVVGEVAGRGVAIAPLRLDTGVSSLEGHERPYPERYVVGPMTASIVNGVRRVGGRVIAVGTTPVRALAAVSDDHGEVHPGRGWTDVVVGPDNPVTAVDGMITGWHEPEASHLMMLEAIAGRDVIDTAYAAALEHGYLWHEFGDSHLILPDRI
jgi:S-adenosylmethionine:tRNA ribosyltransferase-isomerase